MENYTNKSQVIRSLMKQALDGIQSEPIEANFKFANYARVLVTQHNSEADEKNRLRVQHTGGRLIIVRKHVDTGELFKDVRFKQAYDIVNSVIYHGNEISPVQYDQVKTEFQRLLNAIRGKILDL
jgi:hypothetical protein